MEEAIAEAELPFLELQDNPVGMPIGDIGSIEVLKIIGDFFEREDIKYSE